MTSTRPGLLAGGVVLLGFACAAAAEESPAPGIQDNSFLAEEAYNQEPGVVQHIQTFSRLWNRDEWLYTFTQEWPAPGITHQLSYTLPYQKVGGIARPADLLLNYRYQMIGSGETKVACSPRLSLLLPTGDEKAGTGSGTVGVQVLVPLSIVLGEKWVSHTDAGGTILPRARDAVGDRATARAINFAQSIVWLVNPRFNVLLESTWARGEAVVGPGRTVHQDAFLVSPGIRWAYDFKSGLQIVPGIAFPFGVGPSRGQKSVFLYLSFEAPVWKKRA